MGTVGSSTQQQQQYLLSEVTWSVIWQLALGMEQLWPVLIALTRYPFLKEEKCTSVWQL